MPRASSDTSVFSKYADGAVVIILSGLFAVLAWRSVQHVNTLWDEMNDHRSACALLEHPLTGSGLDGSQARLPMYVTAAVYTLAGPSLRVARLVSIIFGSATIIATYYAGRRWFNRPTALLAAALLAVSPYFVGFARTALTEGDAFCPLLVLLTMLAFDAYLRNRGTLKLFLAAVTLGLATATKYYTLTFIPILMLCDAIQQHLQPVQQSPATPRQRLPRWPAAAFALEFAAMAVTQLRLVPLAIALWAAGLAVLVIGLIVSFAHLADRGRANQSAGPWPTIRGWLVILPLAGAVCLALFPEHVLHPEIPRALLRRLIRKDHVLPMTPFWDPLRLYLGIILLKNGLPLGVLSIAALLWAWISSPREPRLRLLLAAVVIYLLLLATMPIRQTFYLMSIYPLLILLLSAFIVWTALRLRTHRSLQTAWIALVATAGLYLLGGLVRAYPDFGFYGYETVADRWLGAEARGYRNLIQVTNDGTEDALAWCLRNVPPGKRVVSYLWDDHVIDACLDRHPPRFELVRRLPEQNKRLGPPIDDADYLILDLNNYVSYHDAPAAQRLAEYYDPQPVHTVWRGRGVYRMGVINIYRRK